MFPNLVDYMKAKYGNLPAVEVSREEFIQLMMKSGKSNEQAELNAKLSELMGSTCMIGNKLVGIKKEE
jgi:hypothetical protein